jgi:hemin uptake protein HemP
MLNSDHLLDGQREVLIRHGTEVYRLRLTRQGKLILQK